MLDLLIKNGSCYIDKDLKSCDIAINDGKIIEIENKELFIGEFTKQVNLSEYPRGIYIVQIKTNDSFISKRIVLQ